MIRFAAKAAAATAKIPNAPSPKKPFPLGDLHHVLTWFFGPTRIFVQNDTSVGSTVLQSCCVPLLYNGPLRFPKNAISPGGLGPPSNTWYPGPTRVLTPNGISIGSAVFVWVPNVMLYSQWGRKPPKLPLSIEISSRRHPAR